MADLLRAFLLPAVLAAAPAFASDGVYLACSFETLPDVVTHYPSDRLQDATLRFGGRAPVTLHVGQGQHRFESANVEGYGLTFAPQTGILQVSLEGQVISEEQGTCLTVNGPVNTDPLRLGAPTPTPVQPDPGKWQVSKSVSKFDDTATVVLSLPAENTLYDRFGQTKSAALFLRCKENTTVLYVNAGGFFLSDIQGRDRVDMRVDTQKPFAKSMNVSTDNTALGLWNGGVSIPVIKQLLGGETLFLRLTPHSESPLEIEFDIRGLEEAVRPLRDACHW
ncbi:type VI secretion system-associated protein TagO [Antarctobacter sp.]|uniref:type VI secretion system-associated protein TagO n=1 Tax=Antarctobacter sp. TaxID=1872577 RepID=UPI002B277BEA|nr:type VI secretion system-associated protein TagO [Antarctobacter sp.]